MLGLGFLTSTLIGVKRILERPGYLEKELHEGLAQWWYEGEWFATRGMIPNRFETFLVQLSERFLMTTGIATRIR